MGRKWIRCGIGLNIPFGCVIVLSKVRNNEIAATDDYLHTCSKGHSWFMGFPVFMSVCLCSPVGVCVCVCVMSTNSLRCDVCKRFHLSQEWGATTDALEVISLRLFSEALNKHARVKSVAQGKQLVVSAS